MAGVANIESVKRIVLDGDEAATATDATISFGGNDDVTAHVYSSPGVDALPVAGDYAVTVPIDGSGAVAVVGFIDPANEGTAADGETRLYARDADRKVVATVWLKADGSVRCENEKGFFEISADGQFNANGNFTVDP